MGRAIGKKIRRDKTEENEYRKTEGGLEKGEGEKKEKREKKKKK